MSHRGDDGAGPALGILAQKDAAAHAIPVEDDAGPEMVLVEPDPDEPSVDPLDDPTYC